MKYVKVYEQSQPFTTELQVRQKLSRMNRMYNFNGLQFHDNRVFYK